MKQILIDFSPFSVRSALVAENKLTELIIGTKDTASLTGNIYAAKVTDIVKNQFAFVNIGEHKNGLLQLDDYRQRGMPPISRGSRVLVQVLRDSSRNKGALLSCELSFAGRLLVLTKSPEDESYVKISNKITSAPMREHLKELCDGLCPAGFGIIVRTEAANADANDIALEIQRLSKEAAEVLEQSKHAPMPSLLYGNEKIYTRALKDLLDTGAERIVTNCADELDYIKSLAFQYAGVADVVFNPKKDFFDDYDIETHINRALRQKTWLKSGAYILIEETAACTYIDVNTGKFAGKKDLESTANQVNLEAAKEIAAQIRLRNISGAIIVDFVGRHPEPDVYISDLMTTFKAVLGRDRTPAVIVDWNELNVVQLTRKHSGPSLKQILMSPCSHCSGDGRLYSAVFFADKINKEIIKIYNGGFCGKIKIRAHEDITRVLESSPQIREIAEIKTAENASYGFYEINSIPPAYS